ALRRAAAVSACLDSACRDAASRDSRRSAPAIARERRPEGGLCLRPRAMSCSALRWTSAETLPPAGGGSFTPARRAFERPIAIACFGDRTPCLPSRTWWISSRTNSPAAVVGALPSARSSRAFSSASLSPFSGMSPPLSVSLAGSDLGQRLRGPVAILLRDVREADYADQTPLFDAHHPRLVVPRHQSLGQPDIVLRRAGDDLATHDLADL